MRRGGVGAREEAGENHLARVPEPAELNARQYAAANARLKRSGYGYGEGRKRERI